MTFVEVVCEHLESLVLSDRKPLHAGLCVPYGQIAAFFKYAVGLIDACRLIDALDVGIPLRMELVVEIGAQGGLP